MKRILLILIMFSIFNIFAQETNQGTENNNAGEATINSDEERERRREERRLQRETERRQIEEERIKNEAIYRELEERGRKLEAERRQLEAEKRKINDDLTRQNQSEAERKRQENIAAEREIKLAEEEKKLAEAKKAEKNRKANMFWLDNGKKLWSVGINAGTSFIASPLIIGNINITAAPLSNLFFEAGFEYGAEHGRAANIDIEDLDYYSLYPYFRLNCFAPFKDNGKGNKNYLNGGFYIGLGAGYMDSHYLYKDPQTEVKDVNVQNGALEFNSGFYFASPSSRNHLIRLGYGFRTNFKAMNHRMIIGYAYRFGSFK